MTRALRVEPAEIRQLLNKVGGRDEIAFRRLYELFSRRVYAFLLHRFRSESLAEEITSDTLLEVWKTPDRFRGEAAFSTYLLSIARLKALERLRKDRSEPDAEDVDALDEDIFVDETTPEDVVAIRQRSRGVRECLDTLPDAQREALFLAYYEGLNFPEIASLAGVSKDTVGTRMFYARRKIEACLKALLARERNLPGGSQ